MLKAVAIGRLEEVVVAGQTLVGRKSFFLGVSGEKGRVFLWVDSQWKSVTPPPLGSNMSPLPQGGGKDEEFSGQFRPQKESKKSSQPSKLSIFKGEKC